MKFGGGCLCNVSDFLKAAKIVKKEKETTAIVVSAVNGITTELFNGIELAKKSEINIEAIIQNIRNKHRKIVNEAINNENTREEILEIIESKIRKLERLFFGVAFTEEINDPVKTLILSFGERLAAIILAGVLDDKDIPALALEADSIGIITDSSFENATAIMPVVKENFKQLVIPKIQQGFIPVITGYFGCTENGKITIFGRNGSDYSAAVVAYGIEAERIILWKDVNGFMSADPSVVQNASKIEQLSFYEAAELAYFGAKILHPRALEPLQNSQINIVIRNFTQPQNTGTTILSKYENNKSSIKSVTYNKEIAVLRIHGPGVGYKPGIIGEIGNLLSKIGVNIYSIITSQTCINLLINPKDSLKSYTAITELVGEIIQNITLEKDIGLIAIVGEGLMNSPGLAAKVFTAVARRGINIEMISAGASEIAYSFIVKRKNVEETVKAIHHCLFK